MPALVGKGTETEEKADAGTGTETKLGAHLPVSSRNLKANTVTPGGLKNVTRPKSGTMRVTGQWQLRLPLKLRCRHRGP